MIYHRTCICGRAFVTCRSFVKYCSVKCQRYRTFNKVKSPTTAFKTNQNNKTLKP